MLLSKPRGVPRVNDRSVLNGIYWVLLGEDHAPSGIQSVMMNELHVIRSVKLFCTVMPALFAGINIFSRTGQGVEGPAARACRSSASRASPRVR
jgi:hypothetical protein